MQAAGIAHRIDRTNQPKAACKLVLARVAQQLPLRAQNDRQLAGVDTETLDQCLRLRVGIGIERLAWMRIAPKKVLQAEYVAVIGSAYDHRSPGSGLNERNPAQYQSAHNPLAQLRFRDQQSP